MRLAIFMIAAVAVEYAHRTFATPDDFGVIIFLLVVALICAAQDIKEILR